MPPHTLRHLLKIGLQLVTAFLALAALGHSSDHGRLTEEFHHPIPSPPTAASPSLTSTAPYTSRRGIAMKSKWTPLSERIRNSVWTRQKLGSSPARTISPSAPSTLITTSHSITIPATTRLAWST